MEAGAITLDKIDRKKIVDFEAALQAFATEERNQQ